LFSGEAVSARIEDILPWAAHRRAAPITQREGNTLVVSGNGTRCCAGGWQVRFSGLTPGIAYRIRIPFRARGISLPSEAECLSAIVFHGSSGETPVSPSTQADYDSLIMAEDGDGWAFRREGLAAPSSGTLALFLTLRWKSCGEAAFQIPEIAPMPSATPPRRIRIAIATGSAHRRRSARIGSVADNVAFYLPLCEAACAKKAQIIVLPEIALHWGVAGDLFASALPLASPEVRAFAACARAHAAHILLGLRERDDDAVFNSAALIGPEGIIGAYRKTHLADRDEAHSGILPGEGFPVFETAVGRIGSLICMDNAFAEASRAVALNGADILCLPIMGDHRADRFSRGNPQFNEELWKAVLRTRALDNQIVLAVARNETRGSCVIDPRGEFAAYNNGEEDILYADVDLDPGWRTWAGGSHRDIAWLQRRPHLYSGLAAAASLTQEVKIRSARVVSGSSE
jgi:predicted amidohydrolase